MTIQTYKQVVDQSGFRQSDCNGIGVEKGLLLAYSIISGSHKPSAKQTIQALALLRSIIAQQGVDAEGAGIDVGQRSDSLTEVMSIVMFG